jgi:hypothetical protein
MLGWMVWGCADICSGQCFGYLCGRQTVFVLQILMSMLWLARKHGVACGAVQGLYGMAHGVLQAGLSCNSPHLFVSSMWLLSCPSGAGEPAAGSQAAPPNQQQHHQPWPVLWGGARSAPQGCSQGGGGGHGTHGPYQGGNNGEWVLQQLLVARSMVLLCQLYSLLA